MDTAALSLPPLHRTPPPGFRRTPSCLPPLHLRLPDVAPQRRPPVSSPAPCRLQLMPDRRLLGRREHGGWLLDLVAAEGRKFHAHAPVHQFPRRRR
ncbi:hypothetical protein GQ55_2G443100 [Panicum hallii var. hallii]|uniref:Uncharacterized protein n=1 Tax=Panicum hallii var. hallii TaxID=1504633 RepID=A0A2T7EYZ1_9POAL|nr:hypothetical protein GQ55_2G443100 [Panicum hallii var. hallii]